MRVVVLEGSNVGLERCRQLVDDHLSAPVQRRLLTGKRVANERLHDCGYEFTYPTYREGYRAAVAEDVA